MALRSQERREIRPGAWLLSFALKALPVYRSAFLFTAAL
jgi:hypothetical protein